MFAKSLAAAINDHMAFNQDFLLSSTLTSATPRQTRVICGHERKPPKEGRASRAATLLRGSQLREPPGDDVKYIQKLIGIPFLSVSLTIFLLCSYMGNKCYHYDASC